MAGGAVLARRAVPSSKAGPSRSSRRCDERRSQIRPIAVTASTPAAIRVISATSSITGMASGV
jgi:hypothetical protein